MKLVKFFLFLCLMAVPLSGQASANEDVEKVEKYLNNLSTARAKFTQIDPDGGRVTGTFYLNRPGRLRFEYDPPVNDFVVADGALIYFYDAAVQEQSHAPIGQTLADFILRSDLSLSGDIQVTELKRAAGLLQLTLVQTADPTAGSLSLGFSEDPLQLKKWRVVDPQGAITEISLADMETGLKLKDSLFYYHKPTSDMPQYNR